MKATLALACAMIVFLLNVDDIGAEGRPVVKTMNYSGIGLGELTSVYRRAYINAGFIFKGVKNSKGGSVRLVFSFVIPEYPHKKGGTVIVITSHLLADQICAPCSVYRETSGPLYVDYDDSAELVIALKVFAAAESKAIAEIETKLGTTLSSHNSCVPAIHFA